jgi:hypothetical protein
LPIWRFVSNASLFSDHGDVSQIFSTSGRAQEIIDPADEFSHFRLTNHLPDTRLAPLQMAVQVLNPALFGLGRCALMVEKVDQQHVDAEFEAL